MIILKNDKTIIAYHFGQYYGLLKKEWRLPKIEIDWLIKVLRNGCFHNGPVICSRLASGQNNLPCAIMTNLGYITGPLWKHSFINTILTNRKLHIYICVPMYTQRKRLSTPISLKWQIIRQVSRDYWPGNLKNAMVTC
jgi:hypothetical protein